MLTCLQWFPAHSLGAVSGIALEEFDTAVNARHSVIKLLESNFDSTEPSVNSQRVHGLLAPLG
jgi:hypothetical protein